MILQALVEHYEALVDQGKIARPGWSDAKISFALCINDAGELEQVSLTKIEQERGKKTVLAPQSISLPAPVKRSSGIASNFLWDNSGYLLGADGKGKPQRSLECFNACKDLHHQILDGIDSSAAKALLAFFDHWDPAQAAAHPALQADWDELTAGANLVFRHNGVYVQNDPLIRQAWQDHYDSDGDGPKMVCLVTGEKGPVEAVHPSIKGVAGAQSSGAALVSFNAPAFCSYGREQSLNAPVSKYAAFAYTSALNYLLADRDHLIRVGDTTILFWSEDGQTAFQDLFKGSLFGAEASYSAADLQKTLRDLCAGDPVEFEESRLDPNTTFYILGLAPNASRLSVRFFFKNSFGRFIKNVQAHQDRLEIIRPSNDSFDFIPLWKLLDATVSSNSRDKSPSSLLTGETLRAILTDTRYPASLLNGVTLRIRADHKIDRTRAAILKAYYLKNPNPKIQKEVLTVCKNPGCGDTAYVLGQLFSVYEDIQSAANPGINATIMDRYFNSAASTPAIVFPTLGKLAQKHLKKIQSSNSGLYVSYRKQLTKLFKLLPPAFPTRLSLPQQGAFQIGYYHQTQDRYQKKEDTQNV